MIKNAFLFRKKKCRYLEDVSSYSLNHCSHYRYYTWRYWWSEFLYTENIVFTFPQYRSSFDARKTQETNLSHGSKNSVNMSFSLSFSLSFLRIHSNHDERIYLICTNLGCERTLWSIISKMCVSWKFHVVRDELSDDFQSIIC